MVRGKISLGRAWFSRVFPGWAGPEEADDVVVLTTPWEGSGRYNDLQHFQTNAIAAAVVGANLVPDDEQFWVPYAEMWHDDPALTTHAFLQVRDRAGNRITVSGGGDVTAGRRISIRRPIIIPEGGFLQANLVAPTAAATNIFVALFFVRTKIGEYVPAL